MRAWRIPLLRAAARRDGLRPHRCLLQAALAFAILPVVQAQTSQPQITGHITEAATGVPIAGATVALISNGYHRGSSPDEARTTTDRDGTYRFDGIKAGGYTVEAFKEGFVKWSYKHDANPLLEDPFLELTPTRHFQDIDIQLRHEAVIRGTVLDPSGLPIAGVLVAAVPKEYVIPEVIHFVPSVSAKTDANGQFVLRGMAAGTYFACVNGPGGYGYYDMPHTNGEWYHETWYGGASSYLDSTSIPLKEGEERSGVQFAVATEKRYNVIVWPSGPEGGTPVTDYAISLEHRNHGVTRQADGSYLIPGIPPGHYTITSLALTQSGNAGMGAQNFDVTSADVAIHLHAGGPGEISGTARWEGEPGISRWNVLFRIVSEEGASQSVIPDAQGNFHLSGVLPGHYRLIALPVEFGPPAIPVNVACGGQLVSKASPLVVGDRQNISDCKVTLRKP